MSDAAQEKEFQDGYKSVFSFPLQPGENVPALTQTLVRDWLRARKGPADRHALDDWSGSEDVRLPSGTRITTSTFKGGRSGDLAVRYRVTDYADDTDYRVTISAFSTAQGDGSEVTIVIDVARNSGSQDTAIAEITPPRLVGQILEQRSVYDFKARLQGAPHTVHGEDIDELLGAITDQERQVAIIVGSSLSLQTDEQWRHVMSHLTAHSVGVASIFSVSANAVDALNEKLPEALIIPPGHIRTIAPRVVLDNPDARRHPLLSPEELAGMLGADGRPDVLAVQEHAVTPRRYLLDGSLPAGVRRLNELLDKEERKLLLDRQVDESLASQSGLTGDTKAGALKLPRRSDLHGTAEAGPDFWPWFYSVLAEWLGVDSSRVSESSVEEDLRSLDSVIRREREALAVHERYLTEVEEEKAALEVQLASFRDEIDSLEAQLEAAQERLSKAPVNGGDGHGPLTADPQALSELKDKVAEVPANGSGARESSGPAHWAQPAELNARAEVDEALQLISSRLEPIIARTLEPMIPSAHWTDVLKELDRARGRAPGQYNPTDPAAQLRMLTERLGRLGYPFDGDGDRAVSTVAQELRSLRNKWSHHTELDAMDAFRAHDQASRLLVVLNDPEGARVAEERREKIGAQLWGNAANGDVSPTPSWDDTDTAVEDLAADTEVMVRRDAEDTPLIGAARVAFEAWEPAGEEDPDVLNQLFRMNSKQQVRAVVEEIVEFEGPIQLDRLLVLVAREFGYRSLHDRRSKEIERQVRHARTVVDADRFVWPLDIDPREWREFRPTPGGADRNFL